MKFIIRKVIYNLQLCVKFHLLKNTKLIKRNEKIIQRKRKCVIHPQWHI
jgi:hypothetical protein